MRISDWSSDVCSSDLVDRAVLYRVLYVHQPDDVQRMGQGLGLAADFRDHGRLKRMRRQRARSQERRVGKACVSPCTSRWSPHHETQTTTPPPSTPPHTPHTPTTHLLITTPHQH